MCAYYVHRTYVRTYTWGGGGFQVVFSKGEEERLLSIQSLKSAEEEEEEEGEQVKTTPWPVLYSGSERARGRASGLGGGGLLLRPLACLQKKVKLLFSPPLPPLDLQGDFWRNGRRGGRGGGLLLTAVKRGG